MKIVALIVVGLAALELLGWTFGGVLLLRLLRRPSPDATAR